MTTISISLPDEMKAFIEAQVSEEGYASASEYLRDLVQGAQKRKAKQELEAKLDEALMSGPATPMTRGDWDTMERRVWENHHQDHPQS